MTENLASSSPSSSGSRIGAIIGGLLLMMPAALACLLSYLIPTLSTVSMSFQDIELSGDAEFIGMDNYTRLMESIGLNLPMIGALLVLRVLAVAILPPLLAFGVARIAPVQRLIARLLTTVPLAVYAPLAVLIAWFMLLRPPAVDGGFRIALLVGDAIMTMVLACGVLLPAYLAALRPESEGRRAFAVIWLISVLGTVALSIQAVLPSMISNGFRETETLGALLFKFSFQMIRMGAGAVLGVMMLLPVMLLGVIAGAIIVFSGVKIEWTRKADEQGAVASRAARAGGLLVLLTVILSLISLVPYAMQIGSLSDGSRALEAGDIARGFMNMIVPALVGVVLVQMPLTYLAALGIGGLRPLGRRSELLLLPFSPFLLLTVTPLLIPFFNFLRDLDMLNNMLGLFPRFGISIPILFVLTLMFKGLEARRQVEGGSFFQTMIAPTILMTVLLGTAAVLIAMHNAIWPTIAAASPEMSPLPVMLMRAVGMVGRGGPVSILILLSGLPLAVIFLPIFGAFQALYLPRLLVTSGDGAATPAVAATD